MPTTKMARIVVVVDALFMVDLDEEGSRTDAVAEGGTLSITFEELSREGAGPDARRAEVEKAATWEVGRGGGVVVRYWDRR